MGMSERQNQHYMNIDSFSQLPFIRSPPENGVIRLFGKEFGGNNTTAVDDDRSDTNKGSSADGPTVGSRKFKCHYCCRRFPTSQALGGHQNAHKRERQQAKRTQLLSAMLHNNVHVYGQMNSRRPGSSAPTLPTANNHTWNSTCTRLHGGHGYNNAHHHQCPRPINVNPLVLCQVPTASFSSTYAHEQMHQQEIPLLNSKNELIKQYSSINSHPDSCLRSRYDEQPGIDQDHVSLDLCL